MIKVEFLRRFVYETEWETISHNNPIILTEYFVCRKQSELGRYSIGNKKATYKWLGSRKVTKIFFKSLRILEWNIRLK